MFGNVPEEMRDLTVTPGAVTPGDEYDVWLCASRRTMRLRVVDMETHGSSLLFRCRSPEPSGRWEWLYQDTAEEPAEMPEFVFLAIPAPDGPVG